MSAAQALRLPKHRFGPLRLKLERWADWLRCDPLRSAPRFGLPLPEYALRLLATGAAAPTSPMLPNAPALAWFSGLREPPSVPGFVDMELIQDAWNAGEVRQALRARDTEGARQTSETGALLIRGQPLLVSQRQTCSAPCPSTDCLARATLLCMTLYDALRRCP